MSVFCAGLNHHHAPVEVREKFAVGHGERLRETHATALALEGVGGVVILSTCNRVEFYVSSVRPGESRRALAEWLRDRAGRDAPFYFHDAARCVRHLFRVVSGLDSMVLGETEILGQAKKAYATAREFGVADAALHRLFQHAFRVAKHVRTETLITRGATSVGAVAVELAGRTFGDLADRRVLVFGAGETSERTARSLLSRGVRSVIVSNRTFARAAELAAEIGGEAIPFDHWQGAFADADILICSTASPRPILTRERVEPLLAARRGRPLLVIDLAVPRDVEPAVGMLGGIHLHDIDGLEQIARQSLAVRRGDLARCEGLIAGHVGEFVTWLETRREAVR